MLNNKYIIEKLPDKGEKIRNSINEIDQYLADPPLSSPMDTTTTVLNQFQNLNISLVNDEREMQNERILNDLSVKLSQEFRNNTQKSDNTKHSGSNELKKESVKYSDEHLEQVKQCVKAKLANQIDERNNIKTKLISLEELIRIKNEQDKQAE
ncbi:unnamed protein product, partial [Didymodactylos carnosus]